MTEILAAESSNNGPFESCHHWWIATKQPAHRPSRRDDILEAAIKVFARKGYIDAAISDVADEADVAVTAVYYHFSGKDDLFAAAMRRVLNAISRVVESVRPGGTSSAEGLRDVIDAVWDWIDEHQHSATLAHSHLPGATRQMTQIRQDFTERHVQRAFDYLGPGATRQRNTAARAGAANLAMHTLVDTLISVHAMRLEGGPLHGLPSEAVRREVHRIAEALVIPA